MAENRAGVRYLISDLCAELEAYLEPDEIREVYRAYLFGAEAHEGQMRRSGEPYIYHPLAVARILSELRMDYQCLIAAILHDVIEDTPFIKEQLSDAFGQDVAELVDGVSKLTHLEFDSREEAQAASFRKMLLAMNKDIRVILVKLADRLHNMRTLDAMPPHKKRRIARETLDIYAPIASRLGISSIQLQLEDLAFDAFWPLRARVLRKAIQRYSGNRQELMETNRRMLAKRLDDDAIEAKLEGRAKHLYSIYRKMADKKLSFEQVMDVFAFRIIVDSIDLCYRSLGAVHNTCRPIPNTFKDYIAIPKANGYQSLHTVLKGPNGIPVEIQIRTHRMHQVAEVGVAAHWRYKEAGAEASEVHANASDWLKDLLDLQQGTGSSIEFLENVKRDLFPDEVYVFTPNNEIKVLSKNATVIDFAYAVHSDVGHRCVAARVNHNMVPLRTRLKSGQTVEIITSDTPNPKPSWLSFVATGRARAAIRGWLRNLEQQESVEFGRKMLEQELSELGQAMNAVSQDSLQALLREWNLKDEEELLSSIGLGKRAPMLAARFLAGFDHGEAKLGAHSSAPGALLKLDGAEGVVVNYAKCCHPIPGDPIVAGFSSGKGVTVHRRGCRNISNHPARKVEQQLEVAWSEETQGEFSTDISVEVENKRGALATIASVIAQMESNIDNVQVVDRDGFATSLRFQISVRDRQQLASIFRRLRSTPLVMRCSRIT